MAEYNLLLKQKLPGIYCIPSSTSSLTWFGVLFIRQGPYQEGVFRYAKMQKNDSGEIYISCASLDFKLSYPIIILMAMYPKWCLRMLCSIRAWIPIHMC